MFWSFLVCLVVVLIPNCEAIPKQDQIINHISISSKNETNHDGSLHRMKNNTRTSNSSIYPSQQPNPRNEEESGTGVSITLCENECFGHGLTCLATVSGVYKCICLPGYTGSHCQQWNGCEESNFCSGHGKCVCDKTACSCNCSKGWMGDGCDTQMGSQCLNHCSGRGICRTNDFTCECHKGYTGEDCSRVIPTVCPHACSGQGECDMETEKCTCSVTTKGDDCSNSTNVCQGCRHGGACTISSAPSCDCLPPFTGQHCEIYSPELDTCNSEYSYCSGFGVCITNGTCLCQDGLTGPSCSKVAENPISGCVNSCSGHGKCNSFWNECECENGFTGKDCNTPLCPVVKGELCGGHGICQQSGDQYVCACDPCFQGADCSMNSLDQCSALCNNHGSCICQQNQNGSVGVCKCNEGWEGNECQYASEDIECCPLDCSGNGKCTNCTCTCYTGWNGRDCATRVTSSSSLSQEDSSNLLSELVQTQEGKDIKKMILQPRSMSKLWD